ncbi:TPA: LemA family protein [Candidatus Saccharibacteria bacterium]|nr:LemA family protein [Candidatus Saccharibacteria bacterium]HIO87516.1 LemA family protein [Candidatus Saccharibacteria bacterium]
MTVLIVLLIVAGALVLWLIGVYNGLVKSNVRVDEAWSDISVQLKRRYDLIPNLVSTVKGFAKQEKEVFENVTKARANAINATGSPAEQAQAENMFTGALKSLFAVAEAYPQLKSDQNFLALQSELSDTENKIQASRRFYNGAARDLNIKIKVFPTNLFARSLGFTEREFFEVENEVEKQNVQVSF